MLRTALSAVLIASTGAVAIASVSWPVGPPTAVPHVVTDRYPGGRTLTDPYRQLENLKSPAVRSYFKSQANYTSAVLGQLGPGRERLRADIARLVDAGTTVSGVVRTAGAMFYLERPAGANDARLMVRADGGASRLLLDPDAFGKQIGSKAHLSISEVLPSPDASKVAVSLVPGGAEFETFTRIIDVATGTPAPDTLSHTWFGVTSWSPDGKALYYNNPPASALLPGHEAERELDAHTYETRPRCDG